MSSTTLEQLDQFIAEMRLTFELRSALFERAHDRMDETLSRVERYDAASANHRARRSELPQNLIS